jgi:hypothetical protein
LADFMDCGRRIEDEDEEKMYADLLDDEIFDVMEQLDSSASVHGQSVPLPLPMDVDVDAQAASVPVQPPVAPSQSPFIDEDDNAFRQVDMNASMDAFIQGGLTEGVEGEDDCVAEEDEDDEDGDRDEEGKGVKKRRHIPLPNWAQQHFREYLAECSNRDAQQRPPLYQRGQFWFTPPNAFFSLEKTYLEPSDLFPSHFFLWDPLCLFPAKTCLKCRCGKDLT